MKKLLFKFTNNCGKIFIGNEALKLYEKNFGKLVIDSQKDTPIENDYAFYSNESKLHQMGYNVVAGEYSEKQRQDILVHLYEKGIMSVFEIERDIENAIHIFKYRRKYQLAVSKWKTDLEFFQKYITKQQLNAYDKNKNERCVKDENNRMEKAT